jgi:hypothetical protein
MKTFAEYLTESKKIFDYRIRIAGDFSDDQLRHLEDALAKYDPVSMSKPKKTPVQKSPMGFDGISNEPIYIIDAKFNYPATPQEITGIWHSMGGDPNRIRINTTEYMDSLNQEAADTESSPLLTKDLLKPNALQKAASKAHASAEVIQNSAESAKFTVAGGRTAPAQTSNQLPMGVKSPFTKMTRPPKPATGRQPQG